MKITEIRQKNIDELNETLKKVMKDLNKVNEEALQKKEKNVKKAWFIKKEIARIKTIIKEKQLVGAQR